MTKVRERIESLRASRGARLTVRGYASDIRRFEIWCSKTGKSPLPTTAETLQLYVAWSLEDGRRINTVNRHIAAIVDAHRRAGFPVPTKSDARSTISDVRRERGEQPQGKKAISDKALVSLARSCDPKTNAGLRNRALLVLGYATTLRRSELVNIELSHITFHEKGLVVFVPHSKQDQESKGRLIPVWAGKRVSTDPVRVVKAWIAARGTWRGPLFCPVRRNDVLIKRGIAGETVNEILKRLLPGAGIDPEHYGAHSLRAGGITASAELGRSDQEIMGLSGHVNANVMRGYVRNARLFSGRNPLAGVL